jgi:hypothetical protein
MTRPSFEELNRAALGRFDSIMGLLGLAGGKRQGAEYLPLNPRRADHKPGSFSINTASGAWADFADDAKGGDLVSLAAYIRREGNGEAARWLADMLGYGSGEAPKPAPQAKAPETAGVWIHPVPQDAPAPPAGNTKHGKPSQVWTYRDQAGAVLIPPLASSARPAPARVLGCAASTFSSNRLPEKSSLLVKRSKCFPAARMLSRWPTPGNCRRSARVCRWSSSTSTSGVT